MKKNYSHENMESGTRSACAPAAPALARRVRRVSTKFVLFLFRFFSFCDFVVNIYALGSILFRLNNRVT